MTTLIHCADLHLTASKDEEKYSLTVFDEIIKLANDQEAEALLLCGDTFDSFEDSAEMREEFRKRAGALKKNCEIFLLAGNHEYLRRGDMSLKQYDFGIPREHVIEGQSFAYFPRDTFDILALPHGSDYAGYAEWDVPEKGSRKRIAMAHGNVIGMAYFGIEEGEEAPAPAIDVDLFVRHKVDYAAMGHIHASRNEKFDSLAVVYPGSARVWRKNEFGPRHVVIIRIGEDISFELYPLKSAGQFKARELYVDFSGNIELLPDDLKDWSTQDRIFLSFSGLVEDEVTARENIRQLIQKIQASVRLVESSEDKITVMSGISSQPLAKKFLELWSAGIPQEDNKLEAWKRARDIGLLKIKEFIEAKR